MINVELCPANSIGQKRLLVRSGTAPRKWSLVRSGAASNILDAMFTRTLNFARVARITSMSSRGIGGSFKVSTGVKSVRHGVRPGLVDSREHVVSTFASVGSRWRTFIVLWWRLCGRRLSLAHRLVILGVHLCPRISTADTHVQRVHILCNTPDLRFALMNGSAPTPRSSPNNVPRN